MDPLHLLALALLQGFTEFLPISSSAHLILLPLLNGWTDQGLAFDVAVHLGTLLAILLYFRREVVTMTFAWGRSVAGRGTDDDGRLAWWVIIGTLPVVVGGLLLDQVVEETLRSPLVIAATTIGFGLLLWWSERYVGQRSEHQLTWRDVLIIGFSQVLALIPGTSRSGITMTAALWLGLTRTAAARFSFLLSIPTILGAALLKGLELAAAPGGAPWLTLATAAAASAISAYICIHLFLKLLERIGFTPFVIYRLLLGAVLLWAYL
ncbi:undecaprenyl-diphosphate phosphatase [Endothiovibrio diazotrophicus]